MELNGMIFDQPEDKQNNQRVLYTGCTDAYLDVVSPQTLEEIPEGYRKPKDMDKETANDPSKDYVTMQFYFDIHANLPKEDDKTQTEQINIKEIFKINISKDIRYNSAKTKIQCIDKFNKTAWLEFTETTIIDKKTKTEDIHREWVTDDKIAARFDYGSARPLRKGELILINLLEAITGVAAYNKGVKARNKKIAEANVILKLDGKEEKPLEELVNIGESLNMKAISEGDFSEIKKLVENINSRPKRNMIKVLLGVKDSKYQVVFGCFSSPSNNPKQGYLGNGWDILKNNEIGLESARKTAKDMNIDMPTYGKDDLIFRKWDGENETTTSEGLLGGVFSSLNDLPL